MPQKRLKQQPFPKYQNSHVVFVSVKMSQEFSPQTSIKYNGNSLLSKHKTQSSIKPARSEQQDPVQSWRVTVSSGFLKLGSRD